MYRITIAGNTNQELALKIKEMHEFFESRKSDISDAPSFAPPMEAPLKEKSKPGRPAKKAEETTAVAIEKTEQPVAIEKPAVELKPSSKEDAANAARDLNGKKGTPALLAVLSQFKAAKMSELKETDYNAFIQTCAKAAA